MTQNGNPLLQPSALPNQAPPFDRIDTAHYFPAVEAAINEARANIKAIKAQEAAPDFANTIEALETASETLGIVSGIFYNQLSCVGGDELQALAEKIGPVSAAFSNEVGHDEEIFARVKAVYEQRATLSLNKEQDMLLEETYKGFVRGGVGLPKEQKKRLTEISERMSVLGPVYTNNVKKSTEAFELVIEKEADLEGLPPHAIEMARHEAEERGKAGLWVFTLDASSYSAFVQYAANRPLREKIWRAFASRAWKDAFDNRENTMEVVRLRHERAQILGYKTHAHLVLEDRMAETPDNVLSFLKRLKAAYRPAALADLKMLQDFARESHGIEDLKPWDVAYYSEKLREKQFDFSGEDLRPYFPLENVLEGMFTHFSKLFDLEFTPSSAYAVWHPDVKAYDVKYKSTGRFMGTLLADFYPRKGKKNGAWMTSYRGQGLFRGKVERPVIAIVCNFTKPTADTPSLLTHDEVTTLFHEMGHATHGLLSDIYYSSLSGTSVKWDFVELPSQLQENWCYERETLDLFAKHYKTGEKIPDDLIDKLERSKNFMAGWMGLRQTGLGLLDMSWHSVDPATIGDLEIFEDRVLAETSLFPRMAGPTSVSFSHIFAGGYSSGYYSYKWAEVLDADAFELFAERGLYDPKTANAYKTEILALGGSEHPAVLYRRFRGRDADPDALFRREGIEAAGEQAA